MENKLITEKDFLINNVNVGEPTNEEIYLAAEILKGGSKGILATKKLIEIETDRLKDGRKKYLSTGEVVERLNIENLNTTLFNKWLCFNKFGDMKRVTGEKKSYFHPNDKFDNNIAKNGYALTGYTSTGKPKVTYKPSILEVLNQNNTKQSIIDFIHRETINPFKY